MGFLGLSLRPPPSLDRTGWGSGRFSPCVGQHVDQPLVARLLCFRTRLGKQLTYLWCHGRGGCRPHDPERAFLLQVLKLGLRHGKRLADFWPQLHHLSPSFDPPKSSIPGQRRIRQWSRKMGQLSLLDLRNLPFLRIEGHVVMAHEQSCGKIREDPASGKQYPDDMDCKARIDRKQFVERDTWMGLDMSQCQCFLLRVWRNLVRPEVLQKLQILKLQRMELGGRAQPIGQPKLFCICLPRRAMPPPSSCLLIASRLLCGKTIERVGGLPRFPAC